MLVWDYEKESCRTPNKLNWIDFPFIAFMSPHWLRLNVMRHAPQFNGIIFQLNASVSVTTLTYYFCWLSYRQDLKPLKRTDFMAFNFILGLRASRLTRLYIYSNPITITTYYNNKQFSSVSETVNKYIFKK